ncbi:hypothetical protein P171DRAFT_425839 [Karstenula rhodostoma CBS 690.94]|uniref:Ubiquitin 3 binding protein But2 C-terminal domain-containing protein n=1 Tax=Karstenula rhodostoma CBS 690.94 TaxID=1392251 RepID=A0A9P4UJ61_9PLEO|nr:hypothetical protein P171DRAFT_425839 [Karstenula rhodostoma CBS 690.94]
MRAAFFPGLFGLTALAETVVHDFPHLVIPLDSTAPDKAYNTQETFTISNLNWTAANWDVPSNGAIYCKIGFTINTDPQRGAPWNIWGVDDNEPYLINVAELPNDSIKKNTTYANQPKPLDNVATLAVYKSGYTNFTWSRPLVCQKGQVASFLLQPAEPQRQWDSGLSWYELDYPHGITYDMYVP